MRKIIFVVSCFLIALLIFIIIVFFLGKKQEKGALQITSSPNAKVYLDDKLIGQTPLCACDSQKMLSVGDHTLRLVPIEGNFEQFQRKITISAKVLTVVDRSFAQTAFSQASIISLSLLDDKKDAQISVISFPDKSQIFLDSNLVGEAPVLLKNITESDHEIKITKEGYKDKTVRIRTVLGYKLEAVIYLGIDPLVATSSGTQVSSPSASTVSTKPTVVILSTPTGFLRVRDSASLGGAEIAQVLPGETYELISEETNWYQIKLKNGKAGWISSSYAEKK